MLLHQIKDIKNGRIIAKDEDININITIEKPVNEEEQVTYPFEYKGYTLKQNEEDGSIEVYGNGGSFLKRCEDLKIAKDFIDRSVV
jgi:hypothetical protein